MTVASDPDQPPGAACTATGIALPTADADIVDGASGALPFTCSASAECSDGAAGSVFSSVATSVDNAALAASFVITTMLIRRLIASGLRVPGRDRPLERGEEDRPDQLLDLGI